VKARCLFIVQRLACLEHNNALHCNAMTPIRKNTTVRLDDELYDGMQDVWSREGIQPSEQMRRALRQWLESKGVKLKAAPRRGQTRRKA
jgi:hypothetical protein